jgi:hypothetical protein
MIAGALDLGFLPTLYVKPCRPGRHDTHDRYAIWIFPQFGWALMAIAMPAAAYGRSVINADAWLSRPRSSNRIVAAWSAIAHRPASSPARAVADIERTHQAPECRVRAARREIPGPAVLSTIVATGRRDGIARRRRFVAVDSRGSS